jgi:hypothetical protein
MILSRKVAAIVGGVAAVAVIGTAGVAAATAAPSPSGSPAPSASPGASPSAPGADKGERGEGRRGHGRVGHLFRGLHGEWVVKQQDGTFVTMVGARGEVTAVSATSITIKAEDGFTATFAVNADTKVRGRDVDKIADVKVGDRGGALGPKSGDTATARVVFVRQR